MHSLESNPGLPYSSQRTKPIEKLAVPCLSYAMLHHELLKRLRYPMILALASRLYDALNIYFPQKDVV